MKEFKNFTEFYVAVVKPLLVQNQLRLDGRESGGNRQVIAYFQYKGSKWKIHGDSRIEPLKTAYQEYLNEHDPFEITKTSFGKDRLTLKKDAPKGTKGMYIYRVM